MGMNQQELRCIATQHILSIKKTGLRRFVNLIESPMVANEFPHFAKCAANTLPWEFQSN
jgi:hypothetical protein